MTEKEKMLSGMIYDPSDDELKSIRRHAHNLCVDFNILHEDDPKRKQILDELIPNNNDAYLQGPIQFDYGKFTSFGKRCYANFNLMILDCAPVTIGDDVYMGANVSINTPIHPFLPEERQMYINGKNRLTEKEYARPITIGNNCWIASNVVICGGVRIGNGVVIGAGSVVIKDIPDNVFAAGNPCKVIRKITKEDSVYLKKNLWPNE